MPHIWQPSNHEICFNRATTTSSEDHSLEKNPFFVKGNRDYELYVYIYIYIGPTYIQNQELNEVRVHV